jgi:NADPH-dependent ferric siderophore reductase
MTVRTHAATVLGRRALSSHLVSITLDVPADYTSTGVPDEYVRVMIPPAGAELALPTIDENWTVTYPEGAVEPAARVYTISDHRVVDGRVQVDVDVALHDRGLGADWARSCRPGDAVGITDPYGLYAASPDTAWQLLVCDLTGVPAAGRIQRGLDVGQRAEVVVVTTSAADEIPLPSPADISVTWQVVGSDAEVSEALAAAVVDRDLPAEGSRYVWLAGEARASRAARRHLRRELGWPQSDFYTCGYWQIDAETWNRRYQEVADQLTVEAERARTQVGDDEGAFLDALDDIYENAGL